MILAVVKTIGMLRRAKRQSTPIRRLTRVVLVFSLTMQRRGMLTLMIMMAVGRPVQNSKEFSLSGLRRAMLDIKPE